MSIIGYSVENYRAFAEKAEIDLRPLTLFFGYNSAGKSALLRFLPLIRDSITQSGPDPLALLSPATRGASFADLKCRLASSPALSFGLKWELNDFSSTTIGAVEYVIRDLPEYRRQVVEKLSINGFGQERLLHAEWIPESDLKGNIPNRYEIKTSNSSDSRLNIRFRGLIPDVASSFEEVLPPNLRPSPNLLSDLDILLGSLAENIVWLQALRAFPPRREAFTGTPSSVESDGRGITQFLAYDELLGGLVVNEVSKWYERATGHRLGVRRGSFAGKELFSFTLSPVQGSAVEVEIVDTGEGMGQVLPVVGLLALAKHHRLGAAPLIAIEHPELHLHQSAHGELAELFCAVAMANRPPTVLVETHSENFLLAVQLAIAKQEMNPALVTVYWVRKTDSGTTVLEKVTFDEFGRPVGENWPPGVFSESASQSREIILARRARGSG